MKFIKITIIEEQRKALLPIENIVSISEEFITGPRDEYMGAVIKLLNGDEITTKESIEEIQNLIQQQYS